MNESLKSVVGHVFYVEDEASVRASVVTTLQRVGIKVSCFDSAESCIEQIGLNGCDLLLADIRLPGQDGFELLCHVKAMAPWLPVVMVTQYGDVTTAVKAMKLGAADFIEKPFESETLVSVICSILEKNWPVNPLRGRALTEKEETVLRLILKGKSNTEIACILNRSKCTVEAHRKHIMQKIGASNVVDLVTKASALGYNEETVDN